MKRKVDWFRVVAILAAGAAAIWLMFALGKSPIGIALGGDMEVTWQPPVLNCDGSQLTNLAGYDVRWGQKAQNMPDPAATGFDITGLTPGDWWVSVSAYNTTGEWSQFVTATKTVKPEEFVTTSTIVYTFVKAEGNIRVLPTLHTVPLGVQCDATQSVNGKYVIPREAVTWSGTARPVTVVGDCG